MVLYKGGKIDIYSPGKNLYAFQNRIYDVNLGRWLQQDPAGYVDGASQYNTFLENPINDTDPNGLDAFDPLQKVRMDYHNFVDGFNYTVHYQFESTRDHYLVQEVGGWSLFITGDGYVLAALQWQGWDVWKLGGSGSMPSYFEDNVNQGEVNHYYARAIMKVRGIPIDQIITDTVFIGEICSAPPTMEMADGKTHTWTPADGEGGKSGSMQGFNFKLTFLDDDSGSFASAIPPIYNFREDVAGVKLEGNLGLAFTHEDSGNIVAINKDKVKDPRNWPFTGDGSVHFDSNNSPQARAMLNLYGTLQVVNGNVHQGSGALPLNFGINPITWTQ